MKQQKKLYEAPLAEEIILLTESILTTSGDPADPFVGIPDVLEVV